MPDMFQHLQAEPDVHAAEALVLFCLLMATIPDKTMASASNKQQMALFVNKWKDIYLY